MTSPILAELYGVMVGDGCLSHTPKRKGSGPKYWIYISGHKFDDLDYFEYIRNLFKELFSRETRIIPRKKENTIFIRFCDKAIFNFFQDKGMPIGRKYDKLTIPDWLLKDNKLLAPFLRGLFDTDGCFVLSKQHREERYYPRIKLTTKSRSFAEEVGKALKKLGITSSISNKGGSFRLEIAGVINVENWVKTIQFRNNKHLKKYIY